MEFLKRNISLKQQLPTQVVDIADKVFKGRIELYSEGSLPKYRIQCPSNVNDDFPFLINNHYYGFKYPKKDYTKPQFWGEIIAYKLGKIIDINVPPAFVAIDSENKISGVLIEWFHNYPNTQTEHYYSGIDYMRQEISDYDSIKGKQHNMETIFLIASKLQSRKILQHNPLQHWANILLFDSLIGNTDRHQENWGVIWDKNEKLAWFAPAFDNGTAMGHKISEHKLNNKSEIEKFVKNGKAPS